MARSRNIKPGLFKNEILGEADPLLTILFVGLWGLADKEGRLEDRPKRIKAEIFPYRELPNFNGYLTELARLGFIDRYQAEKHTIIQILNFTKHQSPHKTERPSDLPAKPAGAGVTDLAPLNNETVTEEAALIPDSLLLIPDSLRKDTTNIYNSEGASNFKRPTIDEIGGAMKLAGYNDLDPELFFAHYESLGWKTATGAEIEDWRSRLTVWAKEQARRKQDKPDKTRHRSLEDDLHDTSWANG